ncbi:MAG: hypothetical protein Q4E50_07110 [Tissierellia bacterium]|nr:hypothetical protein [Tissierellia bacterium]
MKGLFDELVDIYKEIEKEIKEEAMRQEAREKRAKAKKRVKDFNRQVNNNKKPKVSEMDPQVSRVEGEEAKDYKEFKTLRDKNSNLENKAGYIEGPERKKSQLGKYSQSIDSRQEILRGQIDKSLMLDENLAEEKIRREVKELINSLKAEDRLRNARKAFLYSEIFNRKIW